MSPPSRHIVITIITTLVLVYVAGFLHSLIVYPPNKRMRQPTTSSPTSSGCTPHDTSFDSLILATQWPPAYDSIRPHSHWTIHGLWPSRINSATYPCNCKQIPFQPLSAQLEATMNEFWPSLFNKPNKEFWEHEWSKHGTCFTTNQTLYFSLTLQLLQTYNPASSLAKAGIKPQHDPYEYQKVAHAMHPGTIGCSPNPNDATTQILREVGICFDLSHVPARIPCIEPIRDEVNDCEVGKPIIVLPMLIPPFVMLLPS